jgi:hypothetical protein
MSIDLLHAGPLFLAAFLVVAAALLAGTRLLSKPWTVTAIASLLHLAIASVLTNRTSQTGLGWNALTTLLLVSIPVAVGSWRIGVLTTRGTPGPLAYVGSLLLGVGLGWFLLPIVLVAGTLIFAALTS